MSTCWRINYLHEAWISLNHYFFRISGLDPWTGLANEPETVEAGATSPVHYVLCIDNGKFHRFLSCLIMFSNIVTRFIIFTKLKFLFINVTYWLSFSSSISVITR